MKKFEEGDLFINRIKAYPKIRLVGYSGSIFINNEQETQIKLSDFLPIPVPRDDALLTEENGDLLITEDGDYLLIES